MRVVTDCDSVCFPLSFCCLDWPISPFLSFLRERIIVEGGKMRGNKLTVYIFKFYTKSGGAPFSLYSTPGVYGVSIILWTEKHPLSVWCKLGLVGYSLAALGGSSFLAGIMGGRLTNPDRRWAADQLGVWEMFQTHRALERWWENQGSLPTVTQIEAVIVKSAFIAFNLSLAKEQAEDLWFLKSWPSIMCHTAHPPSQNTHPWSCMAHVHSMIP